MLSVALRCGREAPLASADRERRLSVAFRCGRKGGPCAEWWSHRFGGEVAVLQGFGSVAVVQHFGVVAHSAGQLAVALRCKRRQCPGESRRKANGLTDRSLENRAGGGSDTSVARPEAGESSGEAGQRARDAAAHFGGQQGRAAQRAPHTSVGSRSWTTEAKEAVFGRRTAWKFPRHSTLRRAVSGQRQPGENLEGGLSPRENRASVWRQRQRDATD